MKRRINTVAILGSGVMGARIACHFANIGCKVFLMDIVPTDLTEEEKKKNLTLENKLVRNRIVKNNLDSVLKSKPSPTYSTSVSQKIKIGNFEDDLKNLSEVDWIIEAVVENLNIKKSLFEKIEKFRKPNSIISSNTSGIPIHFMLEGRSDDFQQNFCGTHFFNPPRYLQLLEIIPTPKTNPDVIKFLMEYGDLYLGKSTILCKDTPAFIANRIGMFSIMQIIKLKNNFSVSEIDLLTGPLIGKPKSATFRTADVVGIDTLVKVADNIFNDAINDERRNIFIIPDFIREMLKNNFLGDKTKQGFYKKTKSELDKKLILELNTDKFEYVKSEKSKFASVGGAKQIENLSDRLKFLLNAKDNAAEFLRQLHFNLFQYASNRIPEISENIYNIDDAMRAGFGWELGPFEIWDAVGLKNTIQKMEELNLKPSNWIYELLSYGFETFYKIENGKRKFYDITTKSYQEIESKKDFIILKNLHSPVWKNSGVSLHDVGDGVLNLEFHTKMNSIGSEVLSGITKSIEIAEENYAGLVIGNNGQHFSAGANLATMFLLATEEEFDELDFAVREFQNTTMRVRFSSIPVVVAPHSLTLGGGCEVCLHADKIQASAETYIGLVEVGVGIIPAGGGTKEMTLRASDKYLSDQPELPILQNYFMNIATAKTATSAAEAFEMNIFKYGRDEISINPNRVISDAKQSVLKIIKKGYTRPQQREDIKVLGRSALSALLLGIYNFESSKFISAHDKKIAEKLAYIMCGGDLTSGALVSEQYLLDLEREAFLSLITEKKTLERIQSILTTGKPLRN